jgi:transcription initiation factor TFIIE subunit alpha
MDLAQTLVRSVMRAFYETRHILVIDALIIHSALRDDDLAYLMSMNTKDLHKLCGKLREDRFLQVHTRPELREGQQRPINRTYYYIDYRQTIDAIKWRVYTIDKNVQGTTVPVSERKEYFCPRCKSEWTQMEVLDNVGPQGFVCHRCGSGLTHDLERNSTGHEQSTRLNNQLKFITDLLPRIDNVHIPDNTFDVAFSNARTVVRDALHPGASAVPADIGFHRPTAVKGMANTGPQSMSVNISTSDGPTEAEKAAERARKEKIAQQNALPSWMSNSTVTGESFAGATATPTTATTNESDSQDAGTKENLNEKDYAEIDDYFARLKAQQVEEARREMEEEFGSDDDDEDGEDDFEDVVATADNSSGDTPAMNSVSFSSVTKSGVDSPSFDERQTKRVKVDAPPEDTNDDGESEEDVEFEDV